MPGPKYLTMYANDTIPEPETLFDDYSDRATPASQHKMGIDKHMHMGYDLKVPMGEDYWDKVGGYERMTPAQKEAWNKAYGPEIYKFLIERPKGKDLVRWKYQHYMKDYLRCVARLTIILVEYWTTLRRTTSRRIPLWCTAPIRASTWASTAGSTSAGCTRSRSVCRC